MERLRKLFAGLRLKVNEDKSAVAKVWDRKFLGYSFWVAKGGWSSAEPRPKALKVFRQRIRRIIGRNGGKTLASVVAELRTYLLGWKGYFRLADTPGIFRALDQWIARRLRMLVLKQWKQGPTVFRELRRHGVPVRLARTAAAHARSW